MNHNWLDNFSWDPNLLVDKRPITEASQEPVEVEVRRVSTVSEPSPYSDYYGWLYQGAELGGEG